MPGRSILEFFFRLSLQSDDIFQNQFDKILIKYYVFKKCGFSLVPFFTSTDSENLISKKSANRFQYKFCVKTYFVCRQIVCQKHLYLKFFVKTYLVCIKCQCTKYQPNSARGTCPPPATPNQLQNPNGCQGPQNSWEGVEDGYHLKVIGYFK